MPRGKKKKKKRKEKNIMLVKGKLEKTELKIVTQGDLNV